jgi:hypothetical protein
MPYFSTLTRHYNIFKNHPHISYNPETTFAKVDSGHEYEFVAFCKNNNIQYVVYSPSFTL